MILDHIGLPVSDLARSKDFFSRALENAAGFGRDGKPGVLVRNPDPIHVAFAGESRRQVKEFHAAALAAGGKDNGAPGIRAIYHPDYYGAFVRDPDGHNIEAVCHRPE